MRDYETAAAFAAKWKATPAIVTVLGELHEAPQTEGSGDDATGRRLPTFPYATLEVKKDREGLLSAGDFEIDYRRVSVVTHGLVKQDLAAIGVVIATTFDEIELEIENADWMRTEPSPDSRGGRLERGERGNDGPHTWKLTQEWIVWTSRPKSS